MASEKQIEANRKNAQRSTGPNTAEGKAVSRFNGLEHGLRTQCVDVLPYENSDEFATRLTKWIDDYKPKSDLERFLVRQAVIQTWKIERADRYELARLTAQINEAVSPWNLETNPDARQAADLASFDVSNEGERIRRYQFSLERALDRTLARLAKIRKDGDARFGEPIKSAKNKTTDNAVVEELPKAETKVESSTSEPNFEDVLREAADRLAPIKPNSAAVAPITFSVVAKKSFTSSPKPSRSSVDSYEYVDISCLRS